MVATTDCDERPKSITAHKVSKPVMEKKRRARINKCLDQLKTLLESCYSSNIRKRKLEKADILELTVKHLKNLQKIQSFTAASEFSGFRSCLSNVNQYLVMADAMNGMDHWMLSQLSAKLSRSVGRGGVSSTMDSAPAPAPTEPQEEPRRLLPPPGSPEEANTTRTKALEAQTTNRSRFLHSGASRPLLAVKRAAPSNHVACSSPKKHRSVIHGNEAVNSHNSVWRPW